ncbi:MAG TPA: hypothetical protein VLB68_12855 [Pyrinomonadaceae bacterium]|nr:hypothetical protein [Pyrinomonadaceae bacterium]
MPQILGLYDKWCISDCHYLKIVGRGSQRKANGHYYQEALAQPHSTHDDDKGDMGVGNDFDYCVGTWSSPAPPETASDFAPHLGAP